MRRRAVGRGGHGPGMATVLRLKCELRNAASTEASVAWEALHRLESSEPELYPLRRCTHNCRSAGRVAP